MSIFIFLLFNHFYVIKEKINLFSSSYVVDKNIICRFNPDKKNVFQGITFLNQNNILVSQIDKNNILFYIFNFKNCKYLRKYSLKLNSHMQDLSNIKNNKEIFIYSRGNNQKGLSEFKLKNNKLSYIKSYNLNIGKNTPCISKNGYYIASIANNYIYIFDYKKVKNSKPKSIYSFILNPLQRKKFQWKQGISMNNNSIFILTGDNKISHNKYIIIYDYYGKTKKIIKLNTNNLVKLAKKEGKKLEFEGLAIHNNTLYTMLMTGYNHNNIHRLYKIINLK